MITEERLKNYIDFMRKDQELLGAETVRTSASEIAEDVRKIISDCRLLDHSLYETVGKVVSMVFIEKPDLEASEARILNYVKFVAKDQLLMEKEDNQIRALIEVGNSLEHLEKAADWILTHYSFIENQTILSEAVYNMAVDGIILETSEIRKDELELDVDGLAFEYEKDYSRKSEE